MRWCWPAAAAWLLAGCVTHPAGNDAGADAAEADAAACSGGTLTLSLVEPSNGSVAGQQVAMRSLARFGAPLVIPYIQTGGALSVRATLSPCAAAEVRFAIAAGSTQLTQRVTPDCTLGEAAATFAAVPPGDYTLTVEARDAAGCLLQPTAPSVTEVVRVGIGDVFVLLGESTTEGYGVPLGDGAYQATTQYPMDRWDRVPPGTSSSDGRNFPQLGATSVAPAVSGCGAPGSLGCPVGATYGGGPAVTGPVYFSSYAAALGDALVQRLGHPVFLLNLGFGGHTTIALLGYPGQGLDHPSVKSLLAALPPNGALIYTGINDSLCTARCGADATCQAKCDTAAEHFMQLVHWARAQVGATGRVWLGDPTFFSGMDASSMAAAQVRASTDALRGPELYQYFLAHPERIVDGVHPDAEGYRRVAELWADAIATPRKQTFPQLTFLPGSVAMVGSGVIAVSGATAGQPVIYQLDDPSGATSFGPAPLACLEGANASASGLCTLSFTNVTFGVAGDWQGFATSAGAGPATALLRVR